MQLGPFYHGWICADFGGAATRPDSRSYSDILMSAVEGFADDICST